jgi:hypothetical protein
MKYLTKYTLPSKLKSSSAYFLHNSAITAESGFLCARYVEIDSFIDSISVEITLLHELFGVKRSNTKKKYQEYFISNLTDIKYLCTYSLEDIIALQSSIDSAEKRIDWSISEQDINYRQHLIYLHSFLIKDGFSGFTKQQREVILQYIEYVLLQ